MPLSGCDGTVALPLARQKMVNKTRLKLLELMTHQKRVPDRLVTRSLTLRETMYFILHTCILPYSNVSTPVSSDGCLYSRQVFFADFFQFVTLVIAVTGDRWSLPRLLTTEYKLKGPSLFFVAFVPFQRPSLLRFLYFLLYFLFSS